MTRTLQTVVEETILNHERHDASLERALQYFEQCTDEQESEARERVIAASELWWNSVERTTNLILLYRTIVEPRAYQETLQALRPPLPDGTMERGYAAVRTRITAQTIGKRLS